MIPISTQKVSVLSIAPILISFLGNLKGTQYILPVDIVNTIADYTVLLESEIAPAAAFIKSCLHLNPSERPSAHDLVRHPWVSEAYMCCCYNPQ